MTRDLAAESVAKARRAGVFGRGADYDADQAAWFYEQERKRIAAEQAQQPAPEVARV